MMRRRNVLIFPAGTEIGLEIYNSLKYCKDVQLFGAGQDVFNHGKFVFNNYCNLPSIYEDGWLEDLIALCIKLEIEYIFPAYDDIILALSKTRKSIPATVIIPSEEACEVTRSKSATYLFLQDVVRVPKIFTDIGRVDFFPVLVKPDKGQGSFGIKKAFNKNELSSAVQNVPNAIICEYLPGEEYTVDCFSDRVEGLLFCGARSRRRTRNGISVNTLTIDLPEAKSIAKKIGHKLKLYGAWFFQIKRAEDEELVLLEVAPRIAGSMASHRVHGVNFPLLSIYEHERVPTQIRTNEFSIEMDRALTSRYKHNIYFSVLYVDLDDTLILNGVVNIEVIKLIFQSINSKKKVKLITRHKSDLSHTLNKYRLNGLFDDIIYVPINQKKSTYIKERNAILVDDSFSERQEVGELLGIPTFDCSMIEVLTNQACKIRNSI